MLVSSHSVTLWASWAHVPEHICALFPVKDEGRLIIFVPNVVANGVQIPEFLKVLNVGEGVKLPNGTAYVGLGKVTMAGEKMEVNV